MTRTVRQPLLFIELSDLPSIMSRKAVHGRSTSSFNLSRHGGILWIQYAIVKPIPALSTAADLTHDPGSRHIRLRSYRPKPAQVRARIEPIRFDDVCRGSHDRIGHLYCSRRD